MSEIRSDLERDGYAIVRDVFTTPQILRLRADLLEIFDGSPMEPGDRPRSDKGAGLRVELAARYPALRWLLVHPPLLAALRTVLGEDFVYLPEMSAHDSGYGGWHKDTTSQESVGHRFQWDPDFRMVEAAIYLQDNHPLYAGGLDVIPGSHKKPDRFIGTKTLRERVENRFTLTTAQRRLPTRVGDLLLFDFRIDHRATQRVPLLTVPPAHRKLAVFFACSANNAHAQRYRDFIASREDYVYLHGSHTYDTELTKLAGEAGVSLLA
ncbi:hypothetical protein BH11MYX2_BH11MYX2_30020 [soil metagenome]